MRHVCVYVERNGDETASAATRIHNTAQHNTPKLLCVRCNFILQVDYWKTLGKYISASDIITIMRGPFGVLFTMTCNEYHRFRVMNCDHHHHHHHPSKEGER